MSRIEVTAEEVSETNRFCMQMFKNEIQHKYCVFLFSSLASLIWVSSLFQPVGANEFRTYDLLVDDYSLSCFITTYNFDAFFSFLCILIKIFCCFVLGWCESPVPTHANATSFQGRWKKFLFVVIVKFVYRI